jgi:hypothetical protein
MEEAPGAIVQLLARGKQDEYLQGQDTTLFKTKHKRATPFALEHREEYFRQGLRFGQKCRVDIPKRSDSIGEMLLEVKLPILPNADDPETHWVDDIAYTLIRRVQIFMGGVLVVDHERLWNYIGDTLYTPSSKRYNSQPQKTRYVNTEHTILIPLMRMPWSTTRFFPIVSVDVPIHMEVEVETGDACIEGTVPYIPPLDKAALLIQNVFMEKAERFTFLFKPLAYPITWIADVETVFTNRSRQIRIDLSELDFPVKSLWWVAYPVGDESFAFVKDGFVEDALCLESQNLTSETPSTLTSFASRWARSSNSSNDDGIYGLHIGPPGGVLVRGGLDFSKTKRPFLRLTLRQEAFQSGTEYVCKVFAECSRSIRIQYGQVGLF